MRSKIFGIVPILMCFICIISLFGCYIGISNQFESDGLLKYYKIPHKVDEFGNEVYALVGNENINLPENLYICFLYKKTHLNHTHQESTMQYGRLS